LLYQAQNSATLYTNSKWDGQHGLKGRFVPDVFNNALLHGQQKNHKLSRGERQFDMVLKYNCGNAQAIAAQSISLLTLAVVLQAVFM
jgi:hypothetical protein